jgi:single-stranded-DNA-specific exonuclease
MRGLTRRWIVRGANGSASEASGGDVPAPASPPSSSLFERILHARGLCDPAEAARFCEPKLTDLHDPGLMPNIDVAVTRLIDAVKRDELIVIYGDYDVDGVTATAILYHTIKTAAPNTRIRTYVPHRLDEGYGINCQALKQLRSEGASLVISVDCGITAVQSAQTAREIGLDLIVTDHHSLPKRQVSGDRCQVSGTGTATSIDALDSGLPDAVALVHPRLPGSAYPFGELCGAGVAFKVAWRFATTWCNSSRVSEALQKTLINMLPLVALGTIADVVPLIGENRILTAFGLRMIKSTPLHGLRAIIETSALAGEHIDCEKVGFVLAPRLNACGRMGHAAEAMRMLTDAPPDEAMAIARKLSAQNTQRQQVEREIFQQACRMAEDSGQTKDGCRAIVLAHESWHPGVVGIVCSRLVEAFGRPTILMQQQNGVCKGSARSIDGYSIHEALCATSQHLVTYGGHAMAAGLTLATDNLAIFVTALTAHANERIASEQLLPSITIDCDACMHELDVVTVQRLHSLAPFGSGNRRPTLRIAGATLHEPPKQMGSEGKHLQLRLRQDFEGGGRGWMRAVWWRAAEHAPSIAPGMRLDVAIEPKINEWNGMRSVEAELRDVRVVG